MESRGVIYYNKGKKCVIRLITSLWSLIKVYNGNITVLLEGEEWPKWLLEYLKSIGVEWKIIEDYKVFPLVRKASLWRDTPYDKTLFLDADTIVVNPIDEVWELLDEHEFLVPNFAEWCTSGGIMSHRIRVWSKILGEEKIKKSLEFGKAINTGIMAWRKDAKILEEWEKITKQGYEMDLSRIPDELACQVLLPFYPHFVLPDEWNKSVKFATVDEKKTVVIHYHGRKHCGNRPNNYYWKYNYWDMIRKSKFFHNEMFMSMGDRSFKQYFNKVQERRNKLTFVTAVNAKYIDKLKKHFPMWMKTDGLMEQDFVIITDGSCDKELSEVVSEYERNVVMTHWEWDGAANAREKMLTAFIHKIPCIVQSEFWFKLDCDTKPRWCIDGEDSSPNKRKLTLTDDMFGYTLVGHKCGYTRVKGDEYNSKHWLNVLDEWWNRVEKDSMPIFPLDIPVGKRYRHKRIASYCQLHSTVFSEYVSRICKETMGGLRLPIPSHDTLTWYVAMRRNEKVMRHNFKREMVP